MDTTQIREAVQEIKLGTASADDYLGNFVVELCDHIDRLEERIESLEKLDEH